MGELSYERGPLAPALLEDTIPANLAATVEQHGSGEAIVAVHQDIRCTYDEFQSRVGNLAKGFIAAGLQQGDRVGLWSPNYAE